MLRNWDEIKRDEEEGGEPFGDVPETLPGPLTRARSCGRDAAQRGAGGPGGRRASGCTGRPDERSLLGELLFARSRCARRRVDPELALRRPPTASGTRTEEERASMSEIEQVHARQMLDSRGNPTVEVEVPLARARAAAPRCRPARPPASSRPWSCATAARLGRQGREPRRWPT